MTDSLMLNTPTYVRLRERLREDIVSGVWALGQHVTLSEFAARYGVSGNPIREALLHLQGDGVVEMRMHRGAVIPEVTHRFVENVYDINNALSVMLVREAVKRLTQEQFERIEQNAERYEQAVRNGDITSIVAANREFHRSISVVADNPPALDLLRGRHSLIDALRVSLGYREERLAEIVAQHRAIVEALRKRSTPAAVKAVSKHVQSSRENLLAALEERTRQASLAANSPPNGPSRRRTDP